MSTITGQQAINQALTLLAVLQPGETPNTSESNDALLVLNNISDNWAIQRLQNISSLRTSFNLTAATQAYAIGAGQAVNITRPAAIEAASFIDSNGASFPLKQLNVAEWNQIVDRDVQAHIVKAFFYDRQYPNGNIYFTPIPPGGACIMWTWTPSTPQWSSLSDSETLDPGYQRAIIAALALELVPQYAVPAANVAQVQQSYQESMAALRQLNAELLGPEPPSLPAGSQSQAPPTSPSGSPGA
jgi:hypothetical protein